MENKQWIFISIITLILGGSIFFFVTQTAISDEDYAQLMSDSNLLLENADMEDFCQVKSFDPRKSTAVVSGVTEDCSMSLSYYDNGELLEVGTYTHPYDWDLSYGCCMHRYTDDSFIGQNSLLIKKNTHDDWYGFGYDVRGGTPQAEPGKVYEAWVFSKKLLHTGDSRDCSFGLRFFDTNGNDLESIDKQSDTLGKVEGNWSKSYSVGTAPSGTKYVGFQIWCPSGGNYEYLIDGQYIGETIFCDAGDTRQCGKYDVGACEFGTQTCTAEGTWGDCVGAKDPVKEVCGDNIDNDCDGKIDEDCDEQQTPSNDKSFDYMTYLPYAIAVILISAGGWFIFKK